MRVLVTGAGGFIGKNLTAALRCRGETVLECTRATPPEVLDEYCRQADFVFHLAGVNCPEREEDFLPGNAGTTHRLLEALERAENRCPVMLASSVHAGREGSPYGASKRAAEELVFGLGDRGLVYRLPNVFGKWCRPNYNSVVATFCHNIARGLPITIHDPERELELVYIDDLVAELLGALDGVPSREGRFCRVPVTCRVTVGRIAALLEGFRDTTRGPWLPRVPDGEFERKLMATYLSYLPPEAARFPLGANADGRGSFTELLRGPSLGQVSLVTTRPGEIRGRHWHHSKWEVFVAVSGRGAVRQRRLDGTEVLEYPVSGENAEGVYILPGNVHEIISENGTESLKMVVFSSENYDPDRPDTYLGSV